MMRGTSQTPPIRSFLRTTRMGRSSELPMPCSEHQLLLEKYRALLKAHSQNLKKLSDAIGYIPHIEFQVLWKNTFYTRKCVNEARGFLEKHIAEHGC